MKNRTEKENEVSRMTTAIGTASNAFILDFKGMSVPQVTELRKQIREANQNYLVVKNTLALIALKDSPIIELREHFSGPTAVAFGDDAVILAKTLTKFLKDIPSVTFKGALLDGKVVAAREIDAIATLPSREELVAKLLFMLQTPIRNLVTVLSANQRNLAVVLNQISEQKSGGGAPAEENSQPETETGG
jgi:large subunit ribosomal protein L10